MMTVDEIVKQLKSGNVHEWRHLWGETPLQGAIRCLSGLNTSEPEVESKVTYKWFAGYNQSSWALLGSDNPLMALCFIVPADYLGRIACYSVLSADAETVLGTYIGLNFAKEMAEAIMGIKVD